MYLSIPDKMNDQEFFARLQELQDQSIVRMVSAIDEGKIPPGLQLPYHINNDGNENLYLALSSAKEDLSEHPSLLVAGAGDGFSLILANRLGYDVWGVEKAGGILNIAVGNIEAAADLLVRESEIILLNGDMFDPETYVSEKAFGDFDVMYTWQAPSVRDPFLSKFANEAKTDARLVIPHIKERPRQGLIERLEGKIQLLYDGPVQVYHKVI